MYGLFDVMCDSAVDAVALLANSLYVHLEKSHNCDLVSELIHCFLSVQVEDEAT